MAKRKLWKSDANLCEIIRLSFVNHQQSGSYVIGCWESIVYILQTIRILANQQGLLVCLLVCLLFYLLHIFLVTLSSTQTNWFLVSEQCRRIKNLNFNGLISERFCFIGNRNRSCCEVWITWCAILRSRFEHFSVSYRNASSRCCSRTRESRHTDCNHRPVRIISDKDAVPD